MRANHGKGVAYARINGRGVVFISTPAFFLHALDARTGRPLENWGKKKLAYWDRNAPLPEKAERIVPWSDAQAIVLEAYGDFAPEIVTPSRRSDPPRFNTNKDGPAK